MASNRVTEQRLGWQGDLLPRVRLCSGVPPRRPRACASAASPGRGVLVHAQFRAKRKEDTMIDTTIVMLINALASIVGAVAQLIVALRLRR